MNLEKPGRATAEVTPVDMPQRIVETATKPFSLVNTL
jgi:hypothetical protein